MAEGREQEKGREGRKDNAQVKERWEEITKTTTEQGKHATTKGQKAIKKEMKEQRHGVKGYNTGVERGFYSALT